MDKFKHFLKRNENGYLFTDITIIVAIIVLFWKKEPVYIVPIVIIAVVFFTMSVLNQGTKVINKYDKDILAKDDDSDVVHTVKSGDYKGNVDGIKLDGKVYKLPDGVRATVTKSGKIRICSIVGSLIYWGAGEELAKAPDAGWDNLFKA